MWDPHQKNLSDTLEKVQRRSARRITQDFSPTSSASAILEKLKLPPLKERRSTQKAVMMHKIINCQIDITPRPGLVTPITHTSRGHSSKIRVPQSRTDGYLHSFFPSAIRLWNSLPESAVSAPTPSAFKSSVEAWMSAEH